MASACNNSSKCREHTDSRWPGKQQLPDDWKAKNQDVISRESTVSNCRAVSRATGVTTSPPIVSVSSTTSLRHVLLRSPHVHHLLSIAFKASDQHSQRRHIQSLPPCPTLHLHLLPRTSPHIISPPQLMLMVPASSHSLQRTHPNLRPLPSRRSESIANRTASSPCAPPCLRSLPALTHRVSTTPFTPTFLIP